MPFTYNDREGFCNLINSYNGRIAAVVMEPIRNQYPENGFLEFVKSEVNKQGGVLIFDEVSSGFRLCCGGAHKVLGVEPDIITIGKAVSNGYPMAAVLGKSEIMQAVQETFISSTYWTDRIGLVASIATIKKYKENKVEEHINRIGKLVS